MIIIIIIKIELNKWTRKCMEILETRNIYFRLFK